MLFIEPRPGKWTSPTGRWTPYAVHLGNHPCSHLFPRYAGNSPPINLICSSRKVGRRSQTLLKKRGKLTDALTHMPTPTKTSLKKKQIESPATQIACSGPDALLPCCLAALLPCCPATVLPCCSAAPAALLPCYSAT